MSSLGATDRSKTVHHICVKIWLSTVCWHNTFTQYNSSEFSMERLLCFSAWRHNIQTWDIKASRRISECNYISFLLTWVNCSSPVRMKHFLFKFYLIRLVQKIKDVKMEPPLSPWHSPSWDFLKLVTFKLIKIATIIELPLILRFLRKNTQKKKTRRFQGSLKWLFSFVFQVNECKTALNCGK